MSRDRRSRSISKSTTATMKKSESDKCYNFIRSSRNSRENGCAKYILGTGLILFMLSVLEFGECQQITRPIIVSSAAPPSQVQLQQQAQQYYGGQVTKSSPKPLPPPPPPQPTQQQLQQQYQLQQQQQRQQQQQAHQQQQSFRQQLSAQPQQPVIYQKQQQTPPKANQIRVQPSSQVSRGPPQSQQLLNSNEASYEDEEDYKEEPDRLTQLLLNSKFQCTSKKDGYYADESLACEVFHYCHDNVKHSWMCPNQFVFHQVHLICVPPSTENICKQSSSFHFVNEYLYRPINIKEAASNHNVSLRYGDRYYPEGYTHGVPFDDQYLIEQSQNSGHVLLTAPAKQQQHQQQQQPQHKGKQQVYFSADSINIPLSQRRPGSVSSSAQPPTRHPPQSSLSDEEYDYE